MSDRTKIEWTDATWNPVTGCTRVSPGCENCYIDWAPPFRIEGRHFTIPCERCGVGGFEPMAGKFRDSHACSVCNGEGEVRSHAIGSTTGVRLHPERLDQPLRWRRPRKVFVNSLSDLFHDDVPDEYIAQVFAVMARAENHTFQVLTKRHGRMRALLSSWEFREALRCKLGWPDLAEWPLPNVWLGVTVEDQKRADLRVPALLDTPAAVRFLSCEPLLGPVDLSPWTGHGYGGDPREEESLIDWVIAGGESGPNARPMHPDWARSLRDQCVAAGVPFFFKQWGEWAPDSYAVGVLPDRCTYVGDPIEANWTHGLPFRQRMRRVGKKAAGRELDGRTWDEEADRV